MRPRIASLSALVVLPCLAPACDEDAAAEPAPEVCPLVRPARVVPAPAGWHLDLPGATFEMQVLGDRLLYGFGTSYYEREVYLVDRCGGEPELLVPRDRYYPRMYALDTDEGQVLYGERWNGVHEAIDRLDVPGRDEPRPIADLPVYVSPSGSALRAVYHLNDHGLVFSFRDESNRPPLAYGIAGIGGRPAHLWFHSGDPDDPANFITDDSVRWFTRDAQFFVLRDEGELIAFDMLTRETEVVLTGVRAVAPIWDEDRVLALYQALGDDQSEPVRLRDLGTGEEREVTVNDFAALSWGRGPAASAGAWLIAHGGALDDAVLALHGPADALVEAYRLGDLEPIDIPDHVRADTIEGDGVQFALTLDDPDAHVVALWEPSTGRQVELYRGPEPEHLEFRREGERVLYHLSTADLGRRLIAVDLATGETSTVLPRVGWFTSTLDDGRLFTTLSQSGGERLVVIDVEAGVYTTVVDRARHWEYAPGFGVLHLDLEAPEPGIWAVPLPPRVAPADLAPATPTAGTHVSKGM